MRRVRRTFWVLLVTAVLGAGTVSLALGLPPGPLAGILTGIGAAIAATALALAGRIVVVVSRLQVRDSTAHRRRQPGPRP